jgi:hypothetical protein
MAFALAGGLAGFAIPGYAASLSGRVVDLNGQAVADAMVTVETALPGPTAMTVYSDAGGNFLFPARDNFGEGRNIKLGLRALGHELLDSRVSVLANGDLPRRAGRPTTNQVRSAPPSAWLRTVGDHESNSSFILDCLGCHQVPAPQFRDYANAMADVPGEGRADITRRGWTALVNYMNYLSAEEFGRGPNAVPPDAKNVYSVGDGDRVITWRRPRTSPAA